jgi:ABC-type bacteriocin/lantibiotic exporter with double-glycine peptidase domain
MRVWQAGSHLTMERGAQVADWSWRQTARRLRALASLTAPYRARTALSIGSLLAATGTALAPPYLAKLAIDDGIRTHDLTRLGWIVAAFLAAGFANWVTSYAQTYFTGWTGERILADLRTRLFRHLGRLSLGFYERNRAGVIISRLTNDVEALDQLVTDGVTSLVQNTLTLVGTAAPSSARAPRAPTAPSGNGSGSSPPPSPRTSRACASSSRSRASAPTSASSAR